MQIIEHEYEIKLDFEPGNNNPENLYKAMISAFKYLQESDDILSRTLSKENKVTMSLMSIKEGSLRNFIRTRTECPEQELQTNDQDLEQRVKKYFMEGKKAITQGLLAMDQITDEKQLQNIITSIKQAAIDANVISEPFYTLPSVEEIKDLAIVAEESANSLDSNSKITYIEEGQKPIELPKKLSVSKELLSDVDERKTVNSERMIVLKVKKPDFLGDSRWEMKHGSHRIVCKITDDKWIDKFKNKEVLVFPGDSLECRVILIEEYNVKGDLIKTEYIIMEVINVIQGTEES